MKRNTFSLILDTALFLFSSKGFGYTSMSDIASSLSITKAALYKHFASKEEILLGVMEMMDREDRIRAEEMAVPALLPEEGGDYGNVDLESFRDYALAQFSYWTEDKRAREYRHFLSIERFNDEKCRRKWDENFVQGPMDYTRQVLQPHFPLDGEDRAFRLWSAMFLSYALSDGGEDGKKTKERLKRTIDEILEVKNGISKKL